LMFDRSTARKYRNSHPEIADSIIRNLKINQISDVIKEANSLSIIKLAEKRTDIYTDLEGVREQIKDELIDREYEDMIGKLVDKARVNVNDKALEEILP